MTRRARCMCSWSGECAGTGVEHCSPPCGGDQCVCRCGGERACAGCDACETADVDFDDELAYLRGEGPDPLGKEKP